MTSLIGGILKKKKKKELIEAETGMIVTTGRRWEVGNGVN